MKSKIFFVLIIGLFCLLPKCVYANTIINSHRTIGYTKEEVLEKYRESLPKYDYTLSLYKYAPNFNSPIYEGELADGVVDDILRSLNYFRYLAGVDPVAIDQTRMHRNQKGAYTMALNNVLSHHPSKPNGMSDEFFKAAEAGTGAACEGMLCHSANVSRGPLSYNIVKNYVDDSTNVSHNVGHRSSMLDPRATMTSFGYIGARDNKSSYSAISMYYEGTYNSSVNEAFYAWPPAGYLPVESFPATDKTMWSIWIDNDIKKTFSTEIEIIYEGKTYTVSNDLIYVSSGIENTLAYDIPSGLNTLIRRSNNQYVVDKPIYFKIKNLSRGNSLIDIEYNTTFIQAEVVDLEDIQFWYDPELMSDGYTYYKVVRDQVKSVTWNLGDTFSYIVKFVPDDATVSSYKIEEIGDNKLLEIDDENKTIKVLKGGSTSVLITEEMTGKTRRFDVRVPVEVTGVKIENKNIKMSVGSKIPLKFQTVPQGGEGSYSWKTSNRNVVTLDEQGNLVAKGVGKATVTITINGYSDSCEVEVSNSVLGDVTQDGVVDLTDVMYALRISLGLVQNVPNEVASVGDINFSGNIDLSDVMHILRIALNLV